VDQLSNHRILFVYVKKTLALFVDLILRLMIMLVMLVVMGRMYFFKDLVCWVVVLHNQK